MFVLRLVAVAITVIAAITLAVECVPRWNLVKSNNQEWIGRDSQKVAAGNGTDPFPRIDRFDGRLGLGLQGPAFPGRVRTIEAVRTYCYENGIPEYTCKLYIRSALFHRHLLRRSVHGEAALASTDEVHFAGNGIKVTIKNLGQSSILSGFDSVKEISDNNLDLQGLGSLFLVDSSSDKTKQ